MKSSHSLTLSAVTAVLLAAVPLAAHHGSAGFDRKKPVHFAGKVSQLEWSNPHVVLHMETPGADGKVVLWLVETRPPNPLLREGFSKDTFAVGTELTVDGYQAEDGSNHVNASSILFSDGKKILNPGCFDAAGHGLPWGSKACVN